MKKISQTALPQGRNLKSFDLQIRGSRHNENQGRRPFTNSAILAAS
jgi:hypothetical protein